ASPLARWRFSPDGWIFNGDAASSSACGQLRAGSIVELRELDALVLEQDRNTVAHGIGDLAVARHQPLLGWRGDGLAVAALQPTGADQLVRARGARRRHDLQREPRDRTADDVEQSRIEAHAGVLGGDPDASERSGTGSVSEHPPVLHPPNRLRA